MDAVLTVLKEIYSFLLKFLRRPEYSIAKQLIFVTPATATTAIDPATGLPTTTIQSQQINGWVEIDVPPEWADNFCVKIIPSQDFYNSATVDAVTQTAILATIECFSKGGSYILNKRAQSMAVPGTINAGSPGNTALPIKSCGQSFNCQGNKIKVVAYTTIGAYVGKILPRSLNVVVSKGAPREDKIQELYTVIQGYTVSAGIPVTAKSLRIILDRTANPTIDLSYLFLTWYGIGYTLDLDSSQIVGFARFKTFNAMGNTIFISCDTVDIPIPPLALGVGIINTFPAVDDQAALMLEWITNG